MYLSTLITINKVLEEKNETIGRELGKAKLEYQASVEKDGKPGTREESETTKRLRAIAREIRKEQREIESALNDITNYEWT